MLVDFREREGKERRERERNIDLRVKHRLVATCMCPNQEPNLQPRHVPWLGIEPATLRFMGQHSNPLSNTSQGPVMFLIFCLICLNIFAEIIFTKFFSGPLMSSELSKMFDF